MSRSEHANLPAVVQRAVIFVVGNLASIYYAMLQSFLCLMKGSIPLYISLYRLLALKGFSSDVLIAFIHNVLSVPASMLHLHNYSKQVGNATHKM